MQKIFENLVETQREKLLEIAKASDKPQYVYFLSRVKERSKALKSAFSSFDSKIHYAVKANANLEILKVIKEEGIGAEAVSLGEVERALEAGFTKEDIVFTQAALSKEDLRKVIEKGVAINLDSLHQLEWFGEMNKGGSCRIRLNLDVGDGHHAHVITGGALSKFGIHLSEVEKAKEIAHKYDLKITGLHQHIGSFILDENMYAGAMQTLLDFAEQFKEIETLDFGGGFGVPYEPHQQELDLVKLGERVGEVLRLHEEKTGRKIKALFEPGRYLVVDSGVLLAEITDIKEHSNTYWIGINTGFNHLVRPMMYGSYHEITNLSRKGEMLQATIYGNICESGDVFARDRNIVRSEVGDIMAIHNAGAYGYVMASNYNLRDLPEEVVVEGWA